MLKNYKDLKSGKSHANSVFGEEHIFDLFGTPSRRSFLRGLLTAPKVSAMGLPENIGQ